MWNICRTQCSTPRLFRPERVENHLSNGRSSSLFTSSWFASTLPTTIRKAPQSVYQRDHKIFDTSNLFSIDSFEPPSPTKPSFRLGSGSSEAEVVVHHQPVHLKDALSDKHQRLNNTQALSTSMIALQNRDHEPTSNESPIAENSIMSSQDLQSNAPTHRSNESEYKRAFVWNGSQPSVVREHGPANHNVMSVSQDSVTFHNNAMMKAPVQVGQGSGVLFNMETSYDSKSPPENNISEYHSQFKPFTDYVYVAEEHRFRAQTPATKLAAASAEGSNSDVTSGTKAWFAEVEERVQEACKYRARSQNGSTPIDPEWKGTRSKDRDFLALALATQITIAEKRAERASRSSSAKPTSRSSRKELNSAPASLIDAPTPKVRPVKPRPTAPPKTSPPKTAPATDRNNNNVKPEGKVWLKPKKKDDAGKDEAKKTSDAEKNEPKAVPRGVKKAQDSKPAADAQIKSVPLHTTQIKSPEELTGVKSPPPEAWKISIEKGNLQWVNNESPVNFDSNKNGSTDAGILKPVAINGSKN